MRKKLEKLGLALAAVALTAMPILANDSGNNDPPPLEHQVYHTLMMLPYVTVFDNLDFRVDGTTVYLSGEVRMPSLKSDAESAVKHTEGVTRVVDNIRVLPLSPFDNRIRAEEYRAVFGYGGMGRYVAGIHPSVRIIVDNGHVTLVGQVASAMDKNIAGIRANGVGGVFSVQNDLQVAAN